MATDTKPPPKGKSKKPKGTVSISPEKCKGCGLCIAFCPTGVLAVSDQFNAKGYHPPYAKNPEACTGCGLCGMFCPDFAIYGTRAGSTQKGSKEKE